MNKNKDVDGDLTKEILPVSILNKFDQVTFLANRTPETSDDQMQNAFIKLADFDKSGIYITHYSGTSEWERHPSGDELVQIIDGETTLFLLIDGEEQSFNLSKGELMVVPKGIWHRFESPKGLKVLTITPPPTEHSINLPNF